MRLKPASMFGEFKCGRRRYLSVGSADVLWLSSQVMAAGGLEATTQENLATEPTVTTTGSGCNTNSEIPAKSDLPSVAVGCFKES